MTLLRLQTAVQKNEAKLSSFMQFENKMALIPCFITEQSITSYVLTVLEHNHILSDVIECTML